MTGAVKSVVTHGGTRIMMDGYKFIRQCTWGPEIITTRRGAKVLCFNGYKFRRHRVSGLKTRWYCWHHARGCSAVVFTIQDEIIKSAVYTIVWERDEDPEEIEKPAEPEKPAELAVSDTTSESDNRWRCDQNESPVFSTTSKGARMILWSGYKFLRQRVNDGKTRWWCGTHNKKGCKAVIFTVEDEVIIKGNPQHNHPPEL
ncbi:FLYWCH-type zinc finger-containing protein 1 [Papilio machaon]|uniref:FLYWCH-type zinc finger-containing protein 1 n=1 Tax=Papilio machaon TaxID=76193 RepID=A0A0N1IP99_PAPMA|nr:FLYWCH-type zinc finger-containing protein 1 [Papilio machaon]